MDIAELIAREEIRDVLMRYYRGIDRTDWELVRDCFHPDATCDYATFYAGDVDGFMAYLRSDRALLGFQQTMHFAGNVLVEVDGETAHTETYCTALHLARPEHEWAGAFVVNWMRYVDRFERRDGRWRIAHRVLAFEWMRKDEAGGWLPFPPEALGRRDASDPIYRR